MTRTREEVIASATAMFGEAKLAEVLVALDQYGTENHEPEVDRVKLAILQLSDGDFEQLLYWVRTAKLDYRDPLAALEIGPLSPQNGAKLESMAKSIVRRWGKK